MSEKENPDSSFIADSVGPGLVVGLWLFGIVYSVLKVGGVGEGEEQGIQPGKGQPGNVRGIPDLSSTREFTPR